MKKTISIILLLVIFGGTGVWYFKKYDTYEYEHKGFFPLTVLKPLWERKVPTEQSVKIGIITDNHVHPSRINRENKFDDAPRYLKEKYIQPLNEFNEEMKLFKPDLIFQLGDIIEGTGDEDFVGIMGLELVQDELEKGGVPVYFAIGNHELRSVNKKQFKEVFELQNTNQVIDRGDYRFIVLDSNCYPEDRGSGIACTQIGGNISESVFSWLEPLLNTNKNVFVFVHHPPFGKGEGISRVPIGGDRLREMFEKYNVTAVFNGHAEINYATEHNGVRYYSFRGPKKSLKKQTPFQRPFYKLMVEGGEPSVKMLYVSLSDEESFEVDFEEEADNLEKEYKEILKQRELEGSKEEESFDDKENNDESESDYDNEVI